jgi:predicted transcriptional regulator
MHRTVIACAPGCSGLNVARTMAAHRIHAVVLASPGEPPQLVADVDIIRGLHNGTLASTRAEQLARPAAVVLRDDTVARAAECLYEHDATHAVVVADLVSLRPVGMLSVLDIAEAMVKEADQ